MLPSSISTCQVSVPLTWREMGLWQRWCTRPAGGACWAGAQQTSTVEWKRAAAKLRRQRQQAVASTAQQIGPTRLCKTFGPCELFGSKRIALHFVRKMQNVWAKRFASKTFGEMSNVNWPFSTKSRTKGTKHFVCVQDIEGKLWPHTRKKPLFSSVCLGQLDHCVCASRCHGR